MSDPLNLTGFVVDGKYRLEKAVGEGGFAVVYRAEHLVWQRPVALKLFTGLADADPSLRDLLVRDFINEGALLTELSSQTAAIVQARDVGTLTTPDGRWIPYIVLEWLNGKSLDLWLSEGAAEGETGWSLEATCSVVGAVGMALEVAHRQGIAHRDVKPANIFITSGDPRQGTAVTKILDFGVAKVLADRTELNAALAKTGGGISSFTPQYGAPEQFSKTFGATGPWTDVFALALVAVELLTGRPALDGDDLAQLAYASTAGPRPTPGRRGSGLSAALEAVFTQALAVDPRERYATAGAFISALEQASPQLSAWLRGTAGAASLRAASSGCLSLSFDATIVAASGPPSASTAIPAFALESPDSGQTAITEKSFAADGGRSPVRGRLGFAAVAVGLVAAVVGGWLWRSRPAPPPMASVKAPVITPPKTILTPPACPADMIEIPGGELFLGSDAPDALANEKPVHHVKLERFCIERTEVTVEAYQRCSAQGRCLPASKTVRWPGSDKLAADEQQVYSAECNANQAATRANHPVNCVDWHMAKRYCESLERRLPTEAEWEYATRGPDGRVYPWGDEAPTAAHLNACGSECVAWHRSKAIHSWLPDAPLYAASDGFATTAPVGSFPKGNSRFGVADVVGNVWEWTSDWFAPYTSDEGLNPKGPADGTERVIRGGAFNGVKASWLRPSFRFKSEPNARSWGIGFRCAR